MQVFLGANNCVSPLGFSTASNVRAILSEQSALKQHQFVFSDQPFYCGLIDSSALDNAAANMKPGEELTHLEKMCVLSIGDVVEKSKVDLSDPQNLLLLSTTKGNIDVLEKRYSGIKDGREYLPEFGKTLGRYFRCANSPLVVSNACISGLLAIIIAKRFVENNVYKNVLVCGADLVSEFTLAGFKSFSALSDERCRPFDADRKGINLGEAAASLLVTKDPVSNVIITAGASANDANHISGPSRTGDGLFQAISHTLNQAPACKIDFICAHGTATGYNDEMESTAFARANIHELPVHSLKAYYGHTLGAAGVLESILAIESLRENILIKSLGFEKKGTTHLNHVIRQTTKSPLKSCLKTASGFGGCNAAAIFEKI